MTLQKTKQSTRDLFITLAVTFFIVSNVWKYLPFEKDSTDPVDGRSGMSLYTDAASGCQYLGNPLGGITPRMTSAGQHMGCK